ncbi:amine oxidase [Fomitopsis serialis]|uniref:amine oxidase n=1 Tax=Fomitopsis serialis TaxID=139415 RepID=UPI0020075CD2|nr:amine oxidase [Neoantrodia serialis]KAH9914298.1 amine oxidase [Neoantrodia serialis]
MLRATLASPLLLLGLVASAVHLPVVPPSQEVLEPSGARKDATVLILGGGVAGVTAARTLHEQGIDDFILVEARGELGGRLMSHSFGVPSRKFTVELGANWVQGTQTGNGAENPIWTLAKKHNVTTRSSEYFGSISTYDDSGAFDFRDIFDASVEDFHKLVASAGGRVPKRLVDMSARGGYSLTGSHPESKHQMASEYYQFDWEFGTTPEETSWLASSWAHNYTFDPASGGFSYENLLSVDQRGFKTLIQAEARESLKPAQVRLNSTVSEISSSKHGVKVTLTDGHVLRADYALCTFSLGVLQHSDVKFVPPLPAWKREAIHSMSMGTYTKIFLQFPEKFWFDTEMALYADYERGRYPVWQSLDHPSFLPGSGILVVTVTGDFSKRIESLPDSYVQSEVMDVLQMMFPEVDVPEPTDFYFQRWHSDPLFRGSYSNWPAAFLSEHQGNLRANVDERLWFAGEATSRKYFGYLHGAYTEGEAIGQTLAECIQGGGCFGLEHIDRVQNARPYDII